MALIKRTQTIIVYTAIAFTYAVRQSYTNSQLLEKKAKSGTSCIAEGLSEAIVFIRITSNVYLFVKCIELP